MSLKDRLEAKQRRRTVVPVHLTDATEAHEQATGVRVALAIAEAKPADEQDPKTLQALRDQLAESETALAGHVVEVELQALERADWRAVMDRVEAKGWDEILPEVLAESCVDPDLQDLEWWKAQFARPEWSEGDVMAFRLALGELNTAAPQAHAPKD